MRSKRPDETRYLMGASRLGIDPSEYRQHVEAGEKWCSIDGRWEPRESFGPHSRRPDGLNTACLESTRRLSREWQRRAREAKRAAS